MLNNINTRKKTEDFEEKIESIYNKYAKQKIADEYVELWNGFVELIEYIQNLKGSDEMSPTEAINLMRELGMTNEDFRTLLLTSMKNGK